MTEHGEDLLRRVERRKGAKPGPKPKRKKPEGSGRKPLPPELKRARVGLRLAPDLDAWLRRECIRRGTVMPYNDALPTVSDVVSDILTQYRNDEQRDWQAEFENLVKSLYVLGDYVRTLRHDYRIGRYTGLPGDIDGILEKLVNIAKACEEEARQRRYQRLHGPLPEEAPQPAPDPDEDEPEVFVL